MARSSTRSAGSEVRVRLRLRLRVRLRVLTLTLTLTLTLPLTLTLQGEVLPAFGVSGGASLEANFGGSDYVNGIPAGFQGIIKATSIM